jgi:cell division protease FtsH
VHKISIVQRGYEALGHTLQLPSEDRYLRTRQELRAHLAVLVAGRAAEEVVFNETSTGGQNDLQRATEVARAMVAEYGMSDAIGPVAVDLRTRSPYLPIPGTENVDRVSEETAREVDHEVRLLMNDAHEAASRLLQEHRTTLDAVIRLLLEHEVVEGEDVRRLLATATVPSPRVVRPASQPSTPPRQAVA